MTTVLRDTFGRSHNSLRLSVTDRCNIRCFYCMPERDPAYVPRAEILSYEEIERFVTIAVRLGVTKLRITGGEPLVRRDLPDLIQRLSALPGIEDLALTTNGVLLADQAPALYAAGLRRINIHLDTLDRERFIRITRRDELDRVLAGLAACRRLGFDPIKINAVAVKGLVEPDIVPLARYGRENGMEVRFIEFMPLDAQGIWDRASVLTAREIVETLTREISPLIEIPDADPRAPATEYRYADGCGRVGFIASVSRPFCLNCNRLRLTADGHLRYCLFAIEETDVRSLLRGGAPDTEIEQAIQATVQAKWEGHEINTARFVPPPRPMYSIGG
ncbi:MAG TPA: GTP 3',8-cyclase MoaA [Bryobacteraceae bacterium]|nr:GTP 3',8-cyclase MoaA [Bryobacteraceae bacterium]